MAESQTVIGSTVVVNGEFRSEENVSIQGKIQGKIETSADLFVEAGGAIEAEVKTRNIDIHGTIVGNVEASDRFEIHPGGSVTGDVRAPRVVLADGGKYKGNIDMTEGAPPPQRELSSPKSTEKKGR